ncbi:MAG: uroporphyrinogen-III synthase, partial [Candidatus Hadarchaeales archaeon]
SDGSTEKERLAVSTLGRIVEFSRHLGMKAPAVLVVGRVVNSLLNFKGRRVAAFRSSEDVRRTRLLIKQAGGIPNVFEICEIVPAGHELQHVAAEKWDTLVFMSASGVRSAAKFFDLKRYTLIAVGKTTQRELERRGCRHVRVPPIQNLNGVRQLLREKKFGRVLAFRSPLAEEKLEGAVNVIAYQIKPKEITRAVRAYLKTKNDFTLLTSSGLLGYLLKAADDIGLRQEFVDSINSSFVISLGEGITRVALENGIKVNYEPPAPNLESLFQEVG